MNSVQWEESSNIGLKQIICKLKISMKIQVITRTEKNV